MATARFCPQCGTKTILKANFCTNCGESLGGKAEGRQAKKSASPSATGTPWLPLPGLIVLSCYLAVGIGLWVFVLRTEPFSPTPTRSTQASTGGSALPQDHPQVSLPEEVTSRIAELVAQANAAPQDPNAWRTLAEVQFRASQLDASYRSAALASYRKLFELAPNDLDALRGLGNVYYDLEEHHKSIEYYQRYLALDPDNASVTTDLGTMYLYTGQVDRAIASYQSVLAKQPGFFQAHFNLGVAYQEKGLPEQAAASLQQAKSLTDNTTVQDRIDQLLAQFSNGTAPSQTGSTTSPSTSPFQQAVEALFRAHEMMAPKIVRIEWPSQTQARVFFRNFPMAGMPQTVRDNFRDKLQGQLIDAGQKTGVSGLATIELIDIDTQQVMETLTTTS